MSTSIDGTLKIFSTIKTSCHSATLNWKKRTSKIETMHFYQCFWLYRQQQVLFLDQIDDEVKRILSHLIYPLQLVLLSCFILNNKLNVHKKVWVYSTWMYSTTTRRIDPAIDFHSNRCHSHWWHVRLQVDSLLRRSQFFLYDHTKLI